MDIYEMILEALQYQIDNGELTLEEAESVNEVAYDRYVSEANAYNKMVSNRAKEYADLEDKVNKNQKRLEGLIKMRNSYSKSSSDYKRLDEKIKSLQDADETDKKKLDDDRFYPNGRGRKKLRVDEIQNMHNDVKTTKRAVDYYRNNDPEFTTTYGLQGKLYRKIGKLQNHKDEWMYNHGNKGISPEEKYKAGRYLDIQKKINSR